MILTKPTIGKRLLVAILVLTLLLGFTPMMQSNQVYAQDGVWGGTGTQSDPYIISDAADLTAISDNIRNSTSTTYTGTYFKLSADITVSNWMPIGPTSAKSFRGTFDGDGHTITIENIANNPGTEYVGLFGYLQGKVLNLTVDGNISGTTSYNSYSYAGGIAGYLGGLSPSPYGAIINCINKATVSASASSYGYAGGLTAYIGNNNCVILNAYNMGDVTSSNYAGGVGYANTGKISNVINVANISGPNSAPLFSRNYATIAHCYNLADMTENQISDTIIAEWNAGAATYGSTNSEFWGTKDGKPCPSVMACAHESTGAGVLTAATCTDDSYTTFVCDLCEKSYKVVDNGTALGHDTSEITIDATCTEAGCTTTSCSRCDFTETVSIPAIGHTSNGSPVDYPLYFEHTCVTCGDTYQINKDPRLQIASITGVDVTISDADTLYPWVYNAIENRVESSNKGKVNSKSKVTYIFNATSEFTLSFDYSSSKEGTSTAYDYLNVTLNNGTTTTTIAEKFGNNAANQVSTETYNAVLPAGEYKLALEYIKDSSSDIQPDIAYISNLSAIVNCNHEPSGVGVKTAATCTEDEFTTHVCSLCGNEFIVIHEDTALEHDLTFETIHATCTEAGSITSTCTREDYTNTQEIPPLGHISDENPTEYATYFEHTCITCNDTYIVHKDSRLWIATLSGVELSVSDEESSFPWEYDEENDRIQSTNNGRPSSNSKIVFQIISDTKFNLSFDYSSAREGSGTQRWDYMRATISNGSQDTIIADLFGNSDGNLVPASYERQLEAGTYKLVFEYIKDTGTDKAPDRAYVYNLLATAEAPDPLGSESNPFIITTPEEMQALADKVNNGNNCEDEYYKLGNDITLSSNFTPIGTYSATNYRENAFAGHFDGDGHSVILNMTNNTGSNARVGLFGSIAGSLTKPATIANVIVKGQVQTTNGGARVAALVGSAKNATITNCGSLAKVVNNGTGISKGSYAAGILGHAEAGTTIIGSYNAGTIIADQYAAGILGNVGGSSESSPVLIDDSYNVGALSTVQDGSGYAIGGIVASPSGGHVSISDSFATNTENYNSQSVGAIIGGISQRLTLNNVHFESFTGNKWCGGELYGWGGNTPQQIVSTEDLVSKLPSGVFKIEAELSEAHPVLAWQGEGTLTNIGEHEHSYGEGVVTAPTCTADGFTTYTCTLCDHSYKDNTVAKLPHEFGAFTSVGDGTHTHSCATCETPETATCAFGEGVVTTPATAYTPGVMTFTCNDCGYAKIEAIAATGFENGSGTEDDPYLLSTKEDLFGLAANVNSGNDYNGIFFKLNTHILLSGTWTPIGNKDNPFRGTFNGDGKIILGINIEDNTQDFNGLFGYIKDATVEHVIVHGTISGGSFSAGIAGRADNSTIQYCGNNVDVHAADNHSYAQNQGPNHSYAGGIVGYAGTSTTISNCYNNGEIVSNPTSATFSRYAGGLVGNLYNAYVTSSYNIGKVKAKSYDAYTYVGGIVGYRSTATVSYTYNVGEVLLMDGTRGFVGGISGSGNNYYILDAFNYYAEGTATIGSGNASADIPNSVEMVAVEDLKTSELLLAKLSSSYTMAPNGINQGFFILKWLIDEGEVIEPITEINTVYDMYEFMNNVRGGNDYAGKTVTLANDIDLGGVISESTPPENTWTSIGDISKPFAGTFDGQGNTISNMVIISSDSGYIGLFSANSGTIKDLTVTGEINASGSSAGGVVGWNGGTIENCVSEVNINVVSSGYIGGIASDNAGTIIGCLNYGNINCIDQVYGSSSYVGGIVGHNENIMPYGNVVLEGRPVIDKCANYGNVSGAEYVGGIIGGSFSSGDSMPSGDITNCANTGKITGNSDSVGGIVGEINADDSNTNLIRVTNCRNTGAVVGANENVGGIVGRGWLDELVIRNCYNTGNISSSTNATSVGSISGSTKASMINAFTLDSVAVGGVVQGTASGDILTSAEMLAKGFAATLGSGYQANNSPGYPLLAWEDNPITAGGAGSGDIDGDGIISITELITLINFISGNIVPTAEQIALADMDGDGILTMVDVIRMIRKIIGS